MMHCVPALVMCEQLVFRGWVLGWDVVVCAGDVCACNVCAYQAGEDKRLRGWVAGCAACLHRWCVCT